MVRAGPEGVGEGGGEGSSKGPENEGVTRRLQRVEKGADHTSLTHIPACPTFLLTFTTLPIPPPPPPSSDHFLTVAASSMVIPMQAGCMEAGQ